MGGILIIMVPLISLLLVVAGAEGAAHQGVHQLSPLYYQNLPLVYYPSYQYGLRCTGFIGCGISTINAINNGFITGASGIINGAITAGNGIAQGAAATVGGIAQGTGQAIGGVASGTGQAVGGVAGATGGAIGGVASGTGGAIGGVASETGQAIGGQNTRNQLCYSPVGNYYFYCN